MSANTPAETQQLTATERAERQRAVVQALGRVLPQDAILYTPEDTTPYECDGLTAYRERPLVVALPETEAQVQAVADYFDELSLDHDRLPTAAVDVAEDDDAQEAREAACTAN